MKNADVDREIERQRAWWGRHEIIRPYTPGYSRRRDNFERDFGIGLGLTRFMQFATSGPALSLVR